MENNKQLHIKLIWGLVSFFILLVIGIFIFKEFVIPRISATTTSTTSSSTASVVSEQIPPKETAVYLRFIENPSFVSYLTELIGNYQILDHGEDYVILKAINPGYLGIVVTYYYYNSKNFFLKNILKNEDGRIVSSTSDNLYFESVLDHRTRDKYELDSHMIKYNFEKGSDISDIFTHIQKTDSPVSISNFLKNFMPDKIVEKDISDSVSDEFIKQLK
jgi:hypothetical protein